MYLDDIRAYHPENAQEEADQRMMLEYAGLFPGRLLTRENEVAHITSSGFVVNADGSKVLMAHHNIFRVWAWTGGHADGEEDLLSVALREAREETGVTHVLPLSSDIMSLDILPVWGHMKRGRYVPAHQHLNVTYLLVADDGDALTVREGENTRAGFRQKTCSPIPMSGRWTGCIPSSSGGRRPFWRGKVQGKWIVFFHKID